MLEMLLKQAGINPDEIKSFATDLAKFVAVVDNRLATLQTEMETLRFMAEANNRLLGQIIETLNPKGD